STADGTWFVEEARNARRGRAGQDPALASPMPGTVVAVHATDGDEVAAGDALVSIEAMKMEHVLRAPVAGIASIDVRVGERVSRGQDVAVVRESEES
ncbi:MAG TPA: acetyl-CoA carboxylase biotin carboxyl carrier protein subunit, partial [Candidatus Microbacterium pullistercoris]|nr:acetyl-CoA carboxylase biotin carboxyl carrier protein subunit [Candidatus Microbacterium pullistercoris]